MRKAVSRDNVAVRHMIASVVELCNKLDLDCIAEGIESQAQALHASLLGIRYMQGYHFSRPLTASDAMEWVRHPRTATAL